MVALVERETLMAGETYTRFALRKETGHGLPGSLAEDKFTFSFVGSMVQSCRLIYLESETIPRIL